MYMRNSRIFVYLIIVVISLFSPEISFSQSWDGPYRYKDELCYRLSGLNQPVALATRTCETSFLSTRDVLILRIKSPFVNRSGVSRVKITRFNSYGEVWGTGNEVLKCKDGWIYLRVKVWDDGNPFEDYLITVYEKNDFGGAKGRKKTIKTYLFHLNVLEMPMNYNL